MEADQTIPLAQSEELSLFRTLKAFFFLFSPVFNQILIF